jgi:Flp pilus assembly protein TadB
MGRVTLNLALLALNICLVIGVASGDRPQWAIVFVVGAALSVWNVIRSLREARR